MAGRPSRFSLNGNFPRLPRLPATGYPARMESNRLPRFKRASAVASMQLTKRDSAIIRLIHHHRFLRSSHIVSLIGGSSQGVLRRLQLMYHHKFLERPRAQIEYFHHGGSRHVIYGLGTKGRSLLKQETGTDARSLHIEENSNAPRRAFFEHAVLVSDIMVALELACRETERIRLIAPEQLPQPSAVRQKMRWRVIVNKRELPWIIPDRVFAIETEKSPDRSPGLFFLEADRGTMPIVRKSLSQSSFYRKLLAYEATWAQGLHQSQFGFRRFRVLTVTTSAARVNSLVKACSQLKTGHGLFLFCDQATFQKHGDILTMPWKNGRQGATSCILD